MSHDSLRGRIRELEQFSSGEDLPGSITVLPSDPPEAMNEALAAADESEWHTLLHADAMDAAVPPCNGQ